MSNRQPLEENAVLADSGRDTTMLLYDWFKHMTTLSLLTLGGMIGILQGGPSEVKPGMLGFMLVAVALAGITGFDGMNRLLAAELAGKPLPKALHWMRRVGTLSYGVGVGAFLTLVIESVA